MKACALENIADGLRTDSWMGDGVVNGRQLSRRSRSLLQGTVDDCTIFTERRAAWSPLSWPPSVRVGFLVALVRICRDSMTSAETAADLAER